MSEYRINDISALIKMEWTCGQNGRRANSYTARRLYGELVREKRLAEKPKMRYKDCLKTIIKK